LCLHGIKVHASANKFLEELVFQTRGFGIDRKKHFSLTTILSKSGEKQQPHPQKKLKKLCYYSFLHIAQSQSIESYGDSQKRELVNNTPRKKDKEFLKFQII